MKHNKIKNTGILFELLTRQITVDLMESDSSKAVDIVKKYFKNGTQLGKEYELYKILTETKYSTESRAEALIDAVMGSRKKLNNSTIKREKYNLVLLVTFQLAKAESNVISPLRITKGAERTSTPSYHSSPISGTQFRRSISCNS